MVKLQTERKLEALVCKDEILREDAEKILVAARKKIPGRLERP